MFYVWAFMHGQLPNCICHTVVYGTLIAARGAPVQKGSPCSRASCPVWPSGLAVCYDSDCLCRVAVPDRGRGLGLGGGTAVIRVRPMGPQDSTETLQVGCSLTDDTGMPLALPPLPVRLTAGPAGVAGALLSSCCSNVTSPGQRCRNVTGSD